MSPSLWYADGAIFPVIEAAPPVSGRLYLDVGTREGRTSVRQVRRLRRLLHAKGYGADDSLLYVEAPAAEHGEAWWAARVGRAIRFLLGDLPGVR